MGFNLPESKALEFDSRYATARNALTAQNWARAKDHFTALLANNPTDDKSNFMLAFLNLILLLEDPRVEALFEEMGISWDGSKVWSSLGVENFGELREDLNLSTIAALLNEAVLPSVSKAAEHLNRIQSNDFQIHLRSNYFGVQGSPYSLTADRIDAHMLHALVKATEALLRWTIQSHSLDLSWASIRGFVEWNHPTTLESVLRENPDFLAMTNSTPRSLAQAEFAHAISLYVNHAQWLRDPQRRFNRLFYLLEHELGDEAAFRSTLLDIYAALDGPARIEGVFGNKFPSMQKVDLRPAFSNLDFRDALLNHAVGNRFLLPSNFDETLGGLMPNAQLTELEIFMSEKNLLEQRPLNMGPTDLANFALEWHTSEQSRWWQTAHRRASAGKPLSPQSDSWLKTLVQGPALLTWTVSGPGWHPTGYLDFRVNSRTQWSDYIHGHAEQITRRLGAGEQALAWHYTPASGFDPVGGAAHVSDVNIEMRNHFSISTPASTTRTEIRGMTPDGSVLIGSLHEGDWTYPAYDPGDGHFRRLGSSTDAGEVFATASDVSVDGELIVGRTRTWNGYTVATVWDIKDHYNYPWEIQLEWYPSMAVGVGGHLNEVVVGRSWNGSRWEAVVWRRTGKDPWSWRQTESFAHPLVEAADWHESWLYSISADGRTAVGFSELDFFWMDGSEGEYQWRVNLVPLVWRNGHGFSELPFPPVPDNANGWNGARAYYISQNGNFIVGDFTATDESGIYNRSVIFWRYQRGIWQYQLIHAPDWLTYVGTTPLPRITEDGMRIYTTGSKVSDNDVEFSDIVWTRATGWQLADDAHRKWLESAGLEKSRSFKINPNASVIAVTNSQDINIHLLYAPHTGDKDATHTDGSGWMHSNWLQNYFPADEFLFTPIHGWLRVWPAPAGGFFLYHVPNTKWYWTHAQIFPWVYELGSNPRWQRWE